MSTSRPFPAHVPTLTEVVEETPIPEPRYADVDPQHDGGAVVSDYVAEVLTQATGAAPQAEPSKDPDIAVLTEVVPESEVLPPVDALLDDEQLSEDGRVVEAAESDDLTPELGSDLTDQITEHLVANLDPVLEQLADQVLRDLKSELSQRLRHLVSQAVAQELSKRRPS
ncbi:MAG: hypothetical protein ACM3VZ_06405 [Acidobacteriota bacterium]